MVVDPVAATRIVMKAKLSAAFYDVEMARSLADAQQAAKAQPPDLVLISEGLPDADLAAACAALRKQPETRDVAILCLVEKAINARHLEPLRAGADDVAARPLSDAALFARLRAALRDQTARRDLAVRLLPSASMSATEIAWDAEPQGAVGIVSLRPGRALAWQAAFAVTRSARVEILDPGTILARSDRSEQHDVYVIDGDLGRHGDGLAMLSDLRARSRSPMAATLVVAPESDDTFTARAFDLGAGAVLDVATDSEAMAVRIQALLRRKRQADRLRAALDEGLALAMTDPLTGLMNRRHAFDRLAQLRGSYTCMIDIDHFKSINDRFGHAAGDDVLKSVAAALRRAQPDAPVMARIGGEEFLVVLDAATPAAALEKAEGLRRAAGGINAAPNHGVTVSIGVAQAMPGEAVDTLLARADAGLYRAKHNGRNRVLFAEAHPA